MSDIAREAGALLMPYFRRRVTVEYKGEADLVTEADRNSEALIRKRIQALWPDHDVLGEEEGLVDTGSEYRWYVDPLDGTTNFAHSFPMFCVSLGLEHKGQRIAGVVYDPIRVSKIAKLKESLVATGFPSQKRHKNPNIHFYHQITLLTHGIRRAGSAALDLCYVAAGRLEGFWEFNLNPWDTAAGVLMVEEAGGRVSGFDGSPFKINSNETLASNGSIHQQLLREFQEIFAGRGLEALPDPRNHVKV